MALGGCEVGDAKPTTAGRLAAWWVIHTVGPVWRGGEAGEPGLLASCPGARSRSRRGSGRRPSRSPRSPAAVYGYPVELAAEVAVAAVRGHELELVRLVLFDERAHAAFTRAIEQ